MKRTYAKKTKKYSAKRTRSSAEPYPVVRPVPVNTKELKFVDYVRQTITCVPTLGAGQIVYNSQVPEGATASARLGQRVKLLAMHIRGSININALQTGPFNDTVGYWLIYDKQPNGATPTVASLFSQNNNAGEAFADESNGIHGNRFVYIKRFQRNLGPYLAGSNCPNVIPINHYIKIPSKCGITTYERGNTTGLLTGCVNGALFIVPFGLFSTNSSAMNWHSRLYFQDV